MEMRRLGKDGPLVSALGLGTAKFGRNTATKYPGAFALPSDAQIADLLAQARGFGVNLLDTAPAYGSSEERLGAAGGGPRQHWIVVTKAGEEFAGGKSRFDFSGPAVAASVERSLRRLRTDHIDAVLLHSDGEDETGAHYDGAIAALEKLKRQGKIGLSGFSSKTAAGGIAMAARVDVLMVTYNSAFQGDLPAIAEAARRGKGVLLKKVLESGHAADPARALRQALSLDGVSSAIIGTISPAHLAANVESVARSPK